MEKNEIFDRFQSAPDASGTVFQFDWNGEPPEIKVFSILAHLKSLNQKRALVNYGGNDVFSETWWVNLKRIADAAQACQITIGLRENKADGGNYLNQAVLASQAQLVKKELAYSVQNTYFEREVYIIPENAVSVTAYTLKNGVIDGDSALDLRALTSGSFLRFVPVKRNTVIITVYYKELLGQTDRLNRETAAREKALFWDKLNAYMPEKLGTVLNNFCLNIDRTKEKRYTDQFVAKFTKHKRYDPSKYLAALFMDIGKMTEQICLDYYDAISRIAAEEYYAPIEKWLGEHNIAYYSVPESGEELLAERMYAQMHGCRGVYQEEVLSENDALRKVNAMAYAGATPLVNGQWAWAEPELVKTLSDRQARLGGILSGAKNGNTYAVWYPEATQWAETGQEKTLEITLQAGEHLNRLGQAYDYINDRMLLHAKAANGVLQVGKAGYRVLVVPGLYSVFNGALNKLIDFLKNGGIVLLIDDEPKASESGGQGNEKLGLLCRELLGGKYAYLDKSGLIFCMDMSEFVTAVEQLALRDIIADEEIRYQRRTLGTLDFFILYDAPAGKLCRFRALGRAEVWNAETGQRRTLYPQRAQKGYTSLHIPFYTGGVCIIVFDRAGEAVPVLTKGLGCVLAVSDRNAVTASVKEPGRKRAYVQRKDITYVLDGQTQVEQYVIEPDHKWEFQIGEPDTEICVDSFLYKEERVRAGTGVKMLLLGGFPLQSDTVEIEREIINFPRPDPEDEYFIYGKPYRWAEYAYADTIPQFDEHGNYICDIPNMLAINLPDNKNYLWTSIYAGQEDQVELSCSDKPRRMYVNGAFIDSNRRITLKKGVNTVVLRYDGACSTYVRFKSMAIMDDADPSGMYAYPIDAYPYKTKETAAFSCTVPPMMYEMSICAYNKPVVHYGDNAYAAVEIKEGDKGAADYVFSAGGMPESADVKILIDETGNHYGGGLLCAPVRIKCHAGEITLGDINRIDSLADYNGALIYNKRIQIERAVGRAFLDLGQIGCAALIRINGASVGLLMSDPYEAEITDFLIEGDNLIEVRVYPSKRETAVKGLIGPVKFIIEGKIVL